MWYVYFIQQESNKGQAPIKIGYSKKPAQRVKDLQTGNPNNLILRMSLPFETEKEAVLMENCLHRIGRKRFKKLKGEWFIVYGSWKKLIAQSYKMGAGIVRSNPNKYTGVYWD